MNTRTRVATALALTFALLLVVAGLTYAFYAWPATMFKIMLALVTTFAVLTGLGWVFFKIYIALDNVKIKRKE